MAYWLFKSEPGVWSWDMQKAKGKNRGRMDRSSQLSGAQQHALDEAWREGFFLSFE